MKDGFAVELGQGADGTLHLSKEARDVHLHVIGLSRQGKSYFLEHLIRQDILNGAGVCVIDPHGELYKNLCEWLAANNLHKRRRIHLINPAHGHWSVGYNPLSRDDPYIEARVRGMIEAYQKVWNDEESTGHKTLARLLRLIFTTLAFHRLSLREASLLTSREHLAVRHRLVTATKNATLIDGWSAFDHLRPSEFVQLFSSVENRLYDLIQSPGIASMIGQTSNTIDFRTCMDNNHIVLVNLNDEGKVPPSAPQAIGALITADLFATAKQRNIAKAKKNPFYCYIDECGDYLNETVVKGLDQTAKFGLHYVLSHQRLSQLGGRRDDPMRSGVMGGAQSKVVFLQDDLDTASEMGEFLFGKTFDLERPKQILIKPTVVGYTREWLHAEGVSIGEGQSEGEGVGLNSGEGMVLSDHSGEVLSLSQSAGATAINTSSSSSSYARTSSKHEALIPILEDLPSGTYSLDELKHEATVEVRLLEKRQAFAYRADDRFARQFVTSDVVPANPTHEQIDDFFSTVRTREPSVALTCNVEATVETRRKSLLLGDDEAAVEDFWEDQK